MNSEAQKAGERRVLEHLFQPLADLGVKPPAGFGERDFAKMRDQVCQRLAYIADRNLVALADEIALSCKGRNRHRMPRGQEILVIAGRFQSPDDSPSPLMLAVFAKDIGRDAIRDGWAPELLQHLRRVRRFPSAFVSSDLRDRAEEAIDALARFEAGNGPDVSEAWAAHRRGVLRKCEAIREQGLME